MTAKGRKTEEVWKRGKGERIGKGRLENQTLKNYVLLKLNFYIVMHFTMFIFPVHRMNSVRAEMPLLRF